MGLAEQSKSTKRAHISDIWCEMMRKQQTGMRETKREKKKRREEGDS